mgnify:CR=1 FL=1
MLFLIVDDHPLVCSALDGMLRTAFEPCELLQAHSAGEALETVRRLEDIDLVLLCTEPDDFLTETSWPGVIGLYS